MVSVGTARQRLGAGFYGTHFQPGKYTEASEFADVETGEINYLVTQNNEKPACRKGIRKLYGDKEIETPVGTVRLQMESLIFFKLSAAE